MILLTFSGFTIIQFPGGVPEKDNDIEIVCRFGRAGKLTSVTWYRDRPSGKNEKILTVDSQLEVTYGDDRFKGRITVSGLDKDSIRDRKFTLLKVDGNDISNYWCEVLPNIFLRNERNKLDVKGLNVLLVF